MRYLKYTLALGIVFGNMNAAYAFHNFREGLSDLFGPMAWGFYLLLPITFLIIGIIAFVLYRASRRSRPTV